MRCFILFITFPIVYHNADTQKKQIYLNNKGKCGVYMWVNLINNKRYVGSSADLQRRFSAYYSVAFLTKYNTIYIHRALLKYGYSSFSLHIEFCPESELLAREKYYIDLYRPEYNFLENSYNKINLKITPMSGRTGIKNTKVNTRGFSSLSSFSATNGQDQKGVTLDPFFVTGFADAESCFFVNITKCNRSLTGWRINARFTLGVHIKDKVLLESIQSFFAGAGRIREREDNKSVEYSVDSIKDLTQIIIPHFEKYPLLTKKKEDYHLFKLVAELINAKEHLKTEGLLKIVGIKGSLNRGLSKSLQAAFPDVKSIEIPKVEVLPENIPGHWLAGFIDGEGCFQINIYKSKTKIGWGVGLQFTITQHSRDLALLKSFIKVFGCGNLMIRPTGSACDYFIKDLPNILDKFIPFLYKYPLIGTKKLDFRDFCKVAYLMKNKTHLTQEGFLIIKEIKSGINTSRKT